LFEFVIVIIKSKNFSGLYSQGAPLFRVTKNTFSSFKDIPRLNLLTVSMTQILRGWDAAIPYESLQKNFAPKYFFFLSK